MAPVLDDPDVRVIQVGDLVDRGSDSSGVLVLVRHQLARDPRRYWAARHTVTRIGAAHFVGIDPKHGTAGAPTWSPLILDGATLLAD